MKYCPQCGVKRIEHSKFCHECGLNFLQVLEQTQKGIVITHDNDVVRTYRDALEPIKIRSFYGKNINDLQFTPDSKYIGACTADGMIIWDIYENGQIAKIDTKTDDDTLYYSSPAEKIFFTPDRKYVMFIKQNKIIKIKLIDLSVDHIYEMHTPRLKKFIISKDGTLLAGVNGKDVFIWSVTENKLVNMISHQNNVHSIDFTPDGKYIAVEEDKREEILLYKYNNISVFKHIATSDRYNGYRRNEKENWIKISPDGMRIAYFCKEQYEVSRFMSRNVETHTSLTIREMESGNYVNSVGNETRFHELTNIDFSPNSEYVAFGTNRGVILKNIAIHTRQEQKTLYEENMKRTVHFSPNGRLLAVADHSKIDIWKLV